MTAQSYKRGWLDPLLRCDKQQTTRLMPPPPKPPRVKVGDIVQVYVEQRRRITDKPLRRMTRAGIDMVCSRGYPFIPEFHQAIYYAHFLGTVKITETYTILPCEMTGEELEAWAWADGFDAYTSMNPFGDECKTYADEWFTAQHGSEWVNWLWAVNCWHGWVERYFEPGDVP